MDQPKKVVGCAHLIEVVVRSVVTREVSLYDFPGAQSAGATGKDADLAPSVGHADLRERDCHADCRPRAPERPVPWVPLLLLGFESFDDRVRLPIET